MNAITEKPCMSLPVGLNISAPSWTKQFKDQKGNNRHVREGMTDLKIASTDGQKKISEERHNEAREALDHLLQLSSIPVSMADFKEVFKLVNGSVSNSLPQEIFNFKVKSIYSVFADYPACIFNQDTARKLANLNKFFPSSNEIKTVLDQAKSELDREIENLKSLVGYGFETKEDQRREQQELQEKRRQYLQDKANQERQQRIHYLNAITQPLDKLNEAIKEAVERYVPKNAANMNSQALIRLFTEQMNQINDPQIKSILQDKINTIRSAARQIEELRKLGIVLKDEKQGAFA